LEDISASEMAMTAVQTAFGIEIEQEAFESRKLNTGLFTAAHDYD
jgi:hypothetical protein